MNLQLNDKSMYGEKGRIETISGVVDRNTGTASLRAVFPNKNGLLYSGTSGNVILPVTMKGSLVIPQATTFEIQDITYVYKVVDGKAAISSCQCDPCKWRTGIYRERWIERGGCDCSGRRRFAA